MLKETIKNDIIDKVKKVEDDMLLEEIYRILDLETETDLVYVFNDSQKSIIGNRLEDMDNGSFLTSDEADKELDEWLKK